MKRCMLAAGVMAFLLTGCTIPATGSPDWCSSDPADRPAKVLTQPDAAAVSMSASNVVLDVTSNLKEPVRVTVSFGGTLALDIEVPGSASDCSVSPVYRYAYRLPQGPGTATATTDQGQRDTTTLDVAAVKRWVVVQVQAGFPLEVDTWDSQPLWG